MSITPFSPLRHLHKIINAPFPGRKYENTLDRGAVEGIFRYGRCRDHSTKSSESMYAMALSPAMRPEWMAKPMVLPGMLKL